MLILQWKGAKAKGAEISGPSFARKERKIMGNWWGTCWRIVMSDEGESTVCSVDPGRRQSRPHSRQCQSPCPPTPLLPSSLLRFNQTELIKWTKALRVSVSLWICIHYVNNCPQQDPGNTLEEHCDGSLGHRRVRSYAQSWKVIFANLQLLIKSPITKTRTLAWLSHFPSRSFPASPVRELEENAE